MGHLLSIAIVHESGEKLNQGETVVILSHDNSIDCYGRSVCKRVSKLNSMLQSANIKTFFGNYEESKSSGFIWQPRRCFILCLTKAFSDNLLAMLDPKLKINSNSDSIYVGRVIQDIVDDMKSGQCRIIPVLMESNALESVNPELFDEFQLNITWSLDYSEDNSFEYVSSQLKRILNHWIKLDQQLSNEQCIAERPILRTEYNASVLPWSTASCMTSPCVRPLSPCSGYCVIR